MTKVSRQEAAKRTFCHPCLCWRVAVMIGTAHFSHIVLCLLSCIIIFVEWWAQSLQVKFSATLALGWLHNWNLLNIPANIFVNFYLLFPLSTYFISRSVRCSKNWRWTRLRLWRRDLVDSRYLMFMIPNGLRMSLVRSCWNISWLFMNNKIRMN